MLEVKSIGQRGPMTAKGEWMKVKWFKVRSKTDLEPAYVDSPNN